ncbi:replication initiator protein [Apis mellifera associated microvirus 20]|nr:replication initiator protein [Apis mellifera associated microvirus 20]
MESTLLTPSTHALCVVESASNKKKGHTMRCTSPRTVGYQADGSSLSWSPKTFSKEYATFQLPCGKCLSCRLEYARQWAVRCVHESMCHQENCFITLTYSDENLKSDKLQYRDFQLFMKRLRKAFPNKEIGFNAVGEYGDKTKRPHWHAIIFNWQPSDSQYRRSNERGDRIFSSKTLDKLWGLGITEFGSVTFHSAGYVSRYNAKKLIHGKDQEHDLHPISKKSNKHAIGKKWLEKYWQDAFNHGEIILADGTSTAIPRYYEKWLKENQPEAYLRYVTQTKIRKIEAAQEKAAKEATRAELANHKRRTASLLDGYHRGHEISRNEINKKIQQARFKQLQDNLKL